MTTQTTQTTQEQLQALIAEEQMVRGMMEQARRTKKYARYQELLDRVLAITLQIRSLQTATC
jgi:hypothetical protein